MSPETLIEKYSMQAHPEGGFYAEMHRDSRMVNAEGFNGQRSASTSIFFLLKEGQFSALHRIKSDEVWHFYAGEPLEIWEIERSGEMKCTLLGNPELEGATFLHVVKAGNWFGSRPARGSRFSFVGCTVAPGFDFQDFEMPDQNWFLQQFPNHSNVIKEMTRS